MNNIGSRDLGLRRSSNDSGIDTDDDELAALRAQQQAREEFTDAPEQTPDDLPSPRLRTVPSATSTSSAGPRGAGRRSFGQLDARVVEVVREVYRTHRTSVSDLIRQALDEVPAPTKSEADRYYDDAPTTIGMKYNLTPDEYDRLDELATAANASRQVVVSLLLRALLNVGEGR